jgi:hypothetical protein
MKDKLIHQWRDWLLKYVSEGEYELINKENLSVQAITAKNDMDAENQSQLIIKNMKEEQPVELSNSLES